MLSQIYHLCIGILFFIKSKNTIRIILPRLDNFSKRLSHYVSAVHAAEAKYIEVHKCPSSQKE